MARCGTASRKRARARIGGRNQQRAECCRQELTKHAPRLHDRILREPLWTNQQRSHAVVFNSIGELREDFSSAAAFSPAKGKVPFAIERAVLRLELHDGEAGDHLEVANVGRRYAIAEFKCRHPDQQIGQGQPHSSSLILAVDFSSTNRQRRCNKIDW
jgi:hypothetical protein